MRLRALLLASALFLVAADIPDSPPGPLALTAKEQTIVGKGGVAVRLSTGDTGGGAVGVVDVAATPEATWAALMDLEARVAEIGSLKSVSIYENTPKRMGAKFTLGILGTTVVFHILYDLDPANGWVRYRLDKSKENNLVEVQGAYQIYASGGGSRLIYRTYTDSGRSVPTFIKNWLASGSLKEQMGGIRKRAEGG